MFKYAEKSGQRLAQKVLAWESVKFCFCEAPGCDQISRHWQDAGTVPFILGAGTGNLAEFCGRCLLHSNEVGATKSHQA